jgi:hypothetical protein
MAASRRAFVFVALLTYAAAACGSTVQVQDQPGLASGTGDGLGGPGSLTSPLGPASAGTTGEATGVGPGAPTAGGGSALAGTTGALTARGTAGGGTSGDAPLTIRPSRGVTANTITIGVPYQADAAQAQAAFGSTVPVPDVKRYFEIVIGDINAKGGVAGRKLKAEFYETRASDSRTAAQQAQAACAHFTEDKPVLAVVPSMSLEMTECLNKAGVVSMVGALAGQDEATYRRLSAFFDVGALATDRILENLVPALQAQKYFTGWNTTTGTPGTAPVKVGILAPDLPQWRRTIPGVLVPALARVGIKVDPDNVVIWQFPDSTAGNSDAVAQISSAVLRFKAAGVTHFIPAEQNSAALFATPADKQQYHPRYALNSANGVGAHAGGLIPYNMLNGAVGLGWSPSIDLSSEKGNSPEYAGRGTAACLDTFGRAGQPTASTNERTVALLVCDGLKLLKASVESAPAGQGISAFTVLGGLESLGSTFPFAGLIAGRYGPGRHYAVSEGWQMYWDADCKCQTYNGARYTLR